MKLSVLSEAFVMPIRIGFAVADCVGKAGCPRIGETMTFVGSCAPTQSEIRMFGERRDREGTDGRNTEFTNPPPLGTIFSFAVRGFEGAGTLIGDVTKHVFL